MIPWQLGVQQNAAMYSNAHAWMQTFDCCCMYVCVSQQHLASSQGPQDHVCKAQCQQESYTRDLSLLSAYSFFPIW